MLLLSAYDYDSGSDEELDEDERRRRIEDEEDRISQCPTREYLPSLAPSAPSKEAVVESAGEIPAPEIIPAETQECEEHHAPPPDEALQPENATTESSDPMSSTMNPDVGTKRASRASRGRSGRRHRRDTGVSGRALRLVEAAQLGPWPAPTFSKLCNLPKEAPLTPILVRLALRRAWSRPALQLLVRHPTLRGGGLTLEQHELFAEQPERATALLSDLACHPADADATSAVGPPAASGRPERRGSVSSWPWSMFVSI